MAGLWGCAICGPLFLQTEGETHFLLNIFQYTIKIRRSCFFDDSPIYNRSLWFTPLLDVFAIQGLNQDFETGWPKLAIVKFLGVLFFEGRPLITTIKMYLLIEIWHNILYNFMGIILRWRNINKMLEIDNLRNDSQKYLGVLEFFFEGLGVQMTPRCPAG